VEDLEPWHEYLFAACRLKPVLQNVVTSCYDLNKITYLLTDRLAWLHLFRHWHTLSLTLYNNVNILSGTLGVYGVGISFGPWRPPAKLLPSKRRIEIVIDADIFLRFCFAFSPMEKCGRHVNVNGVGIYTPLKDRSQWRAVATSAKATHTWPDWLTQSYVVIIELMGDYHHRVYCHWHWPSAYTGSSLSLAVPPMRHSKAKTCS